MDGSRICACFRQRLFLKEKFRLSLRFMLFSAEKTMPLQNCIPDK